MKKDGKPEKMINFLLSPLTNLKGVGTKIAADLQRLINGDKIFHLLLHKPIRVEQILFKPKIFELKDGDLAILVLKIQTHEKPNKSSQPYKITGFSPSGFVTLIFFKTYPEVLNKLAVGNEVAVFGKIQKYNDLTQIHHPQYVVKSEFLEQIPKINVIYPLTYKITQKFLIYALNQALQGLKKSTNYEEWIDAALIKEQNFVNFVEALQNIHQPKYESDFFPSNKFRKRLAFDELLSWQLAILLAKKSEKKSIKTKPVFKFEVKEKFLKNLPFELTNSQLKVLNEIQNDISSDEKMLRLLQGDVGSGKTIIAIFACLLAISAGKQACVIAPISILAKQHFEYFKKFCAVFEIKIEILTGKTTAKKRREILQNLAQGQIDLLIGTHAILVEDVNFKNLGLAIIDEQHRFGVMQRLTLTKKGHDLDLLLMSATPIPRSLMMTIYGDMKISILDEKPKDRQKIETVIIADKRQNEVLEAIKRAINKGEKVYWICPLIEESEELEMVSVKEKFLELENIFGKKAGLIHGKMKEAEKEKVMNDFCDKEGALKLLVATTVIEVGVDVGDATVIVIENAQNFGLAQLHQLRGRVGRSEKKSYALLIYDDKIGENGRKRLALLRDSNDGFFLAEEDLKMRGSGELLGTKQSGMPEFRIADLQFDTDLLKIAGKNAQLILHRDPQLTKLESQKYVNLLRLFEYEKCLELPKSG